MGTRALLDAVAAEVRACHRCPLAQRRHLAVPGEGNPLSDVLLVGEGPGAREDVTGRPFVGPAGQLLDELLASIGWAREDVFITNVVKCRPPGNRDPEPDEVVACGAYLDQQEAILAPALIVTLGRVSLQRYLPGARISSIHGQVRRSADRAILPMYHPAAALHQWALRETLFGDMRGLPAALLAARQALAQGTAAVAATIEVEMAADRVGEPPDDHQMTLF